MTSHAPDPLTPEERKLAARLARIGPHGEPSPALDARILGAAHAAAARKPAAGRSRRWPAWIGVAATLALALGAVWQLRPVQEVPVVLEETAPVPMRKPAASTTSEPSDAIAARPAPEPPKQLAQPVLRALSAPKPAPLQPPPPPPPPEVGVAPPPVIFDDPSPVDVPAPAPAPPAPPAPEPARPAPRAATAAPARAAREAWAAPASMLAKPTADEAQDVDAAATLTVTDLPVASDRQLPAVDWIERIRQRRDAGDLASARASLALLQHDHPRLPLPDDVRAIAMPPSPDQ